MGEIQKTRLFYLFSSNASLRYQRNVLDILCYPEGHIFRLRYQAEHVSNEIKGWKNIKQELKNGSKGITIYAERTEDKPTAPYRHFIFYPTREVDIVQIKKEGTIYYVDVKLGKFLHSTNQQSLRDEIVSHPFYPLPRLLENNEGKKYGKTWNTSDSSNVPVEYNEADSETLPFEKSQGNFFSFTMTPSNHEKNLLKRIYYYFRTFFPQSEASPENLLWENTIEFIDIAPSMKHAIFYRVLGFYEFKRLWYYLWLKKGEVKTKLKNENLNTVYALPIGRTAFLKMLFYKSEKALDEGSKIKGQVLEIKTEGEAFAGFSQKTIPILSRYNEEVIQIACKRVFDSVFAPISIELKTMDKKDAGFYVEIPNPRFLYLVPTSQETPVEVIAPQPYLVTKISVPAWVKVLLLAFTVLASVLLTFNSDNFDKMADTVYLKENFATISNILKQNSGFVAALCKTFGAFFTLAAAYLAFRKLPVGGK